MQAKSGALLIAVALLGATVSSHHSVPGQFDTSKPMTLKGTVAKIDWINPHIYVHLDVKDEKEPATWMLGTAPPAMMRRAGLTRDMLAGRPGELLTIVAYPARDGTKHLGWITKITYEDGHHFLLDGR
jgi:hypothetical protein